MEHHPITLEQLADWLDGLLNAEERQEVEAHLAAGCSKCQAELGWLRRFAAAARAPELPAPPEHLIRLTKAQFRPRPSPRRLTLSWAWQWAAMAAALLILVMGVSLIFITRSPSLLTRQARLTVTDGKAEWKDTSSAWQTVQDGATLREGDRLRITDGNTWLTLFDGSLLALQPGSEVTLAALRSSLWGAAYQVAIVQDSGAVRYEVQKLRSERSSFSVQSPVAQVSVQGTSFWVTVLDEQTQITVLEGRVRVIGALDSVTLDPKEAIIALANAPLSRAPLPTQTAATHESKPTLDATEHPRSTTHTPTARALSASPVGAPTGAPTALGTVTASATPVASTTATETASLTKTPSLWRTPTPTATGSVASVTPTGAMSVTATPTATGTPTASRTQSVTPTPNASKSATVDKTATWTLAPYPTDTIIPTATSTLRFETATLPPAPTHTPTLSATRTAIPTELAQPTDTPRPTWTSTPTATLSTTHTAIPAETARPTNTPQPTWTGTLSATATATSTPIPSHTNTPTSTPPPTWTQTATSTATATRAPQSYTITLQQGAEGYNGCQDVGILTWEPDTPHEGGNHDQIEIRTNDNVAALLRFDLSAIPTNATVTNAALNLYVYDRFGTRAMTVGAYEVYRSWAAAETTWNQAASGQLWAAPGCNGIGSDRAADAAVSVTMNATLTWYELTLTSLAQRWISDPSANFGLVLKAWGDPAGYTIITSEHGGAWMRPKLTLSYLLPN